MKGAGEMIFSSPFFREYGTASWWKVCGSVIYCGWMTNFREIRSVCHARCGWTTNFREIRSVCHASAGCTKIFWKICPVYYASAL